MYTPLRNTGYNKAMPTINRRALCMHPREKPFRYRTVWRQLHRPRTSPSHKSNIVPGERLAERVWCTNFQSSLIFEYSLPSQCVPVLAPAHFIPSRCEYLFTQLRRNLSDMWRSNFTVGAALRCARRLSPLQKSLTNLPSYMWTEALSAMVFLST